MVQTPRDPTTWGGMNANDEPAAAITQVRWAVAPLAKVHVRRGCFLDATSHQTNSGRDDIESRVSPKTLR